MGNYQSQTDIQNLQKLYNMNLSELKNLKKIIKKEQIKNDLLINQLKQKQVLLKDKVPNDRYENINVFLNEITSEPNTKNELVTLTKNELQTNYKGAEEQYQQQFEEQQERERQEFINKQKTRRKRYEDELNKFNNSSLNALKLFKLSNNFTLNELKLSYKKLAMIYHPDRPNGNNQKFQVITKAYLSLLEELNLKKPDKNYMELKNGSSEFMEEQRNNPKKNIKMTDRFDASLFNKIYNENKLAKADDDGYGSWMKETEYKDADIKQSDLFSEKFNVNVFNSTFSEGVKKKSNEIIDYKTPTALNSNSGIDSYELGVEKINNFSGDGYADYRQAHSGPSFITTKQTDVKQFKSLEDIKKHREKIVPLSDAELRKLNDEDRFKEEFENRRRNNVVNNERNELENYNKINKRMLQSNFFK